MFQTSVGWIPASDEGTRVTLARMGTLARHGAVDPTVRGQALSIVAGIPGRDSRAQVRAIRGWLGQHVRFTRDPIDAELLHDPALLLRQLARRGYIAGDCDDAAILAAALARSVGLRTRWQVIGFRAEGPMAHVYAEAASPGPDPRPWWEDFDVTRPVGAAPPIQRRWTIPV